MTEPHDDDALVSARELSVGYAGVQVCPPGLRAVDRLGPPRLPARLRAGGVASGGPVLGALADAPELLELLAAAERLLGATGSAVALCPVYGEEVGR